MPSLAPTPSIPVLDLFSLKGETALITGGSRGIGAAIATGLAQAGAAIILVQRDSTNTSTRDGIRAAGGRCEILQGELGGVEQSRTLVKRAVEIGDVSILVNCAGMLVRADAVDTTEEDWFNTLNTNLSSLFALSQACGAHFLSRGAGNIINIASINTFIGGNRLAAYTASKAGVGGLTKALSNEWSGRNVRVNALAPGCVETDINTEHRADPEWYNDRVKAIPGGRWGVPEDFAGPAVFLASRASAYMTGEIMVVDGGFLTK